MKRPSKPLSFIRSLFNAADLRPLRKGEPGFGSRQYVFKSVKRVLWDTPRASVRAFQQTILGKRIEERVKDNPKGRSDAQRHVTRIRHRETIEKKFLYERKEKIGDIRKFERQQEKFKSNREHNERLAEALEQWKEAGSPRRGKPKGEFRRLTEKDFHDMHKMAEKHRKLHQDFLDYIGSPIKKPRTSRRQTDSKGRPVRDMRRATKPAAQRRAA